jgi:putative restriction endonuclease
VKAGSDHRKNSMKAYVGITDFDWYQFLAAQKELDEVNFWQPGGQRVFAALKPGELFLFKLHSPQKLIVGGGFFAHATLLPIGLAWDSFGIKNGVSSLQEMRMRVKKYRRVGSLTAEDYQVGCILLEKPFFLLKHEWIPEPLDWHSSIVQGKTYDLTTDYGKKLWESINQTLQKENYKLETVGIVNPSERFGAPVEILPRLGQGSFRVLVTDTYKRRCAITGEKTLPALEAAHIKPFGENGPHSIDNGILLRSDIHRLFDKGYVTVAPDYHFEVSKRIKEEFENGRDYYALHGRTIYVPDDSSAKPNKEFVSWHNQNIFVG